MSGCITQLWIRSSLGAKTHGGRTTGKVLEMPSASTMWSLVALGVFGTALAYIVFFKILVQAGASNVMLVTLLIPITAVLLGGIFLGETIRAQEIMGALIIGAGLLFIDGRLVRRLIKPAAP